jgi:hypothetical protein
VILFVSWFICSTAVTVNRLLNSIVEGKPNVSLLWLLWSFPSVPLSAETDRVAWVYMKGTKMAVPTTPMIAVRE